MAPEPHRLSGFATSHPSSPEAGAPAVLQPHESPATHVGVVTRNFLTLGAGELAARTLGFCATIFLARQLGVEAYGVIGFAYAVVLYLSAVADMGIEQGGAREIAESPSQLALLVPTIILARLLFAVLLAVGLAGTAYLVLPTPEREVLALYALTLLALGGSTRWVHVGLEQTRWVFLARLTAEGIRMLPILALVREPHDLVVVPVAQFLGDGAAAVLLYWALWRRGVPLPTRIEPAVVRAVVARTSPLLYAGLLALAIYNSDVLFLRLFRGAGEVGLYLAAYTLINFLGILGTIGTLSLVPMLTRLRSAPAARRELYHTAMARIFAVGMPIAFGGCLLARDIIELVFGHPYAASGPALQILIWSVLFLLMRSVLQAVLIATGRADRVLHVTAWAAAVNLMLNILLIPALGILGAACATVASELIRLLVAHRYALREGFPRASFRRFWRAAVAALAMAVALRLAEPDLLWTGLALGAVGYLAALALVGGIRAQPDGSVGLTV